MDDWLTPTPYPITGDPAEFDIDANGALVTFAEESVQGWNTANTDGIMDDIITLVIILMLILIIRRIIHSLRTRGNA